MPDIITTEHAKNMQAMRHIASMAFILATAMMIPVFLRCWFSKEVPDPLLRFSDMVLPCLLLLASRASSAKDGKQPAWRKKHKRKRDIAAKNDIKYDFHVY